MQATCVRPRLRRLLLALAPAADALRGRAARARTAALVDPLSAGRAARSAHGEDAPAVRAYRFLGPRVGEQVLGVGDREALVSAIVGHTHIVRERMRVRYAIDQH